MNILKVCNNLTCRQPQIIISPCFLKLIKQTINQCFYINVEACRLVAVGDIVVCETQTKLNILLVY